jgi:hypothetical protein
MSTSFLLLCVVLLGEFELFDYRILVFIWHLVVQRTTFALNCYVCVAGTDGCGTSFNPKGAGVIQVAQSASTAGCYVRSLQVVF